MLKKQLKKVKVSNNLIVDAYVLKHYELDDASEYHELLYSQNKLVDYMVYPIYKEFNEDYKELLENQEDILIGETDTEWIFGNIKILVPYCIIPELEK